MIDILGPSGQPLPPNPFQSQQNMSANVSVNTQSAQQAFSDLQKVLENITKGFGVNWDKVTSDRLSAEERLYRAVGDKARARQKELERYSKEAISLIDAETKAKISGYEKEKLSQDELHKRVSDLNKKAAEDKLRIGKEVEQKLAQDRGLGGLIRGKTAEFGEKIGGPIGSTISSAGALLTNPFALIATAIFETAMANARSAKVGSTLASAGLPLGSGAGVGTSFTSGLFGSSFSKLGIALGADRQAQIVEQMAASRTIVDQARGGGFGAIAGNLGLFANILPDASKEMELFTDATKSLGMSQKDISHTFMTTRVSSKDLHITQLDAISAQIEMQKALRNITNDGTVAANVLENVGSFFHDIGKSEAETKRMTLGVGQAGANLPLSQIAGMFAFTQGKMPTEQALFGTNGVGGMMGKGGSGVFGLMGSFLTKVGGQFKDPMQRIYAADALNKQLGLGIQTQDLPQFFNLSNRLMTGGIDQKDYTKQVADLAKSGKQMTVEGIDKLVEIVGPIQMIENFISNFWKDVDEHLIKYFGQNSTQSNFLHNAPRKNTHRTPLPNSNFDVYKGY